MDGSLVGKAPDLYCAQPGIAILRPRAASVSPLWNHFRVPTVICWEARGFSEYTITLLCIMYYLWEKCTVRVKKQRFLCWATHCFYHTNNVLVPLQAHPRTEFSDTPTVAAYLLLGSVWTTTMVHTATTFAAHSQPVVLHFQPALLSPELRQRLLNPHAAVVPNPFKADVLQLKMNTPSRCRAKCLLYTGCLDWKIYYAEERDEAVVKQIQSLWSRQSSQEINCNFIVKVNFLFILDLL